MTVRQRAIDANDHHSGALGRLPSIEVASILSVTSVVSLYSAAAYYLTNNALVPIEAFHLYATLSVFTFMIAVSSRRSFRAISNHFLLVVAVGSFLSILALHTIMFPMNAVATAWLESRVAFAVMLVVFLLMFSACSSLDATIRATALVVLFSCTVNVLEFFSGGELFGWLSTVPGRAAGLYENANDSAMFIAFAIPIIATRTSLRLRIPLYLVSLAGVYVTFSRSGLILLGLAILACELRSSKGSHVRTIVLAGVATLVGLGFAIQFNTDLANAISSLLDPYLDTNTMSRIYFTDNSSSGERWHVLQRGLEEFGTAPLFGHGTGYTQTWAEGVSVHNIFVLILAEYGLLGLAWFSLFAIGVLQSPGRLVQTFFGLFCVAGLFTHNHFDRPAVALLIALYVVWARQNERVPQRAKLR
jgi:hypothetical protein